MSQSVRRFTRTLKVSELFETRRRKDRRVPTIRLTGAWLQHAGFHVGDSVAVEVGEQELYIVKLGRKRESKAV